MHYTDMEVCTAVYTINVALKKSYICDNIIAII